jgi:hypothetical protein
VVDDTSTGDGGSSSGSDGGTTSGDTDGRGSTSDGSSSGDGASGSSDTGGGSSGESSAGESSSGESSAGESSAGESSSGDGGGDCACAPDQYCARAPGMCDADGGVCTNIPRICNLVFNPVCGCDGNDYSNPCFAAAAGQNVDYAGECQ